MKGRNMKKRFAMLLAALVAAVSLSALVVPTGTAGAWSFTPSSGYQGCDAAPPSWTGEYAMLVEVNNVRAFWGKSALCYNNRLAAAAYNRSYERWINGYWDPTSHWSEVDPQNYWIHDAQHNVIQTTTTSATAAYDVETWHFPYPYYQDWVVEGNGNHCHTKIGFSRFVDPGGSGQVWLSWYVGSVNCDHV